MTNIVFCAGIVTLLEDIMVSALTKNKGNGILTKSGNLN